MSEFMGRLNELTEEVRSVKEIVTEIKNFLLVPVPQSPSTSPKTPPPLPSPIRFPLSPTHPLTIDSPTLAGVSSKNLADSLHPHPLVPSRSTLFWPQFPLPPSTPTSSCSLLYTATCTNSTHLPHQFPQMGSFHNPLSESASMLSPPATSYTSYPPQSAGYLNNLLSTHSFVPVDYLHQFVNVRSYHSPSLLLSESAHLASPFCLYTEVLAPVSPNKLATPTPPSKCTVSLPTPLSQHFFSLGLPSISSHSFFPSIFPNVLCH